MPTPDSIPDMLGPFTACRADLYSLAYRMTGSTTDAEDVVQETWVRWSRCDPTRIANPAAWLTTLCTRLALTELTRARRRREHSVGLWLPDPWLVEETAEPREALQRQESVTIAFMLAMERLTPEERAAFLLHDIFAYDFKAVGRILAQRPASARQLASRARRRLREARPRFSLAPQEQENLLAAFFSAAQSGDAAGLAQLVTDTAIMGSDGGGKATATPGWLLGRDAIVAFLLRVWLPLRESEVRLVPCHFNGNSGCLLVEEGRLTTAVTIAVFKGKIHAIYAHRNPEKLAAFSCLETT